MQDISLLLIIGILITMLLSAFFSGMEIAFVSSNRMLAEMDKDKLGLARLPLQVFYKHPNNFDSHSTLLRQDDICRARPRHNGARRHYSFHSDSAFYRRVSSEVDIQKQCKQVADNICFPGLYFLYRAVADIPFLYDAVSSAYADYGNQGGKGKRG